MCLRLLILLLFWPLAALGQGLPAQVSGTVNDFADLLPPAAETRVAAALRAARTETGVQVVLVTLDGRAAQGAEGARLQDHAKALFNAWGPGDPTRNDGILILVLRDDRMMRIALGAGYDSVWDNAAQRVINRSFLPAFRENRMAEGIERGVADTIDTIARPFAARQPAPPAPARGWADALPFIGFCLTVLVILALGLRDRLAGAVTRLRPCPACHRRDLHRHREVIAPASAAAAGQGRIRTRCDRCGWQRDRTFALPRRRARDRDDDRSGGGSGGGTGGRSAGGGASGRW